MICNLREYSTTPVLHSCPEAILNPATAADIAAFYGTNRVQNPDLNANYADPGNDDWRPNAGSPVLNQYSTVAVSGLDAWFEDSSFAGALDDDLANDWTRCGNDDSWVYTDLDGGAARGDLFTGKIIVVVPAGNVVVAGTVNWTNDDVYVLQGRVSVPADITLDIQEGTVVAGEVGTDAYLVVERGGFLDAIGSCESPIIFTSDALPGLQLPGDWGGVVLHGKSTANCGGSVTASCCSSRCSTRA